MGGIRGGGGRRVFFVPGCSLLLVLIIAKGTYVVRFIDVTRSFLFLQGVVPDRAHEGERAGGRKGLYTKFSQGPTNVCFVVL